MYMKQLQLTCKSKAKSRQRRYMYTCLGLYRYRKVHAIRIAWGNRSTKVRVLPYNRGFKHPVKSQCPNFFMCFFRLDLFENSTPHEHTCLIPSCFDSTWLLQSRLQLNGCEQYGHTNRFLSSITASAIDQSKFWNRKYHECTNISTKY